MLDVSLWGDSKSHIFPMSLPYFPASFAAMLQAVWLFVTDSLTPRRVHAPLPALSLSVVTLEGSVPPRSCEEDVMVSANFQLTESRVTWKTRLYSCPWEIILISIDAERPILTVG